MKPPWRAALTWAWLPLLASAGAAACSDIDNHLLEGQQYSPSGACLTPPEVIDDLSGSNPGDNCTPECLTVPQPGGGTAVYITTTCPPYPNYPAPELPDAARDAADPCVGAFSVYFADGGGAVCTSLDGGVDAGTDAADGGAKGDATVEAGATDGASDGALEAAAE